MTRDAPKIVKKLASREGMGIVELLIAALVLGIISLAALNFYRAQHGQYVQQTAVTDMQQNLRAVMNELSTQIRQAGYRAEGFKPAEVLGGNDNMLLVRYHDGDSVRAQIYFLLPDSTGRSNLMSQLNGEAPQVFAEGIDSIGFVAGGAGGDVDWVRVRLTARSNLSGFEDGNAKTEANAHLYRRLESTVMLRNATDKY